MADKYATSPPLTLLTFAPMIDSECVRLILRHFGVDHVERSRLFGWVSLLTLRHGGRGIIPHVFGTGWSASGPRALVDRLETLYPDRRLTPVDAAERVVMDREWARYNGAFGTDVAVIAYYHLLPVRAAMIDCFGAPVTPRGRAVLPYIYPALRCVFRLALQLTPTHLASALTGVRAVLDQTDSLIADGRRFLGGDAVTLADLALASAASPLLLHPGYAKQLPPVDAMPVMLHDLITQTRARPVAALVARIYAAVDARRPV